jgi:hypothetical protein
MTGMGTVALAATPLAGRRCPSRQPQCDSLAEDNAFLHVGHYLGHL